MYEATIETTFSAAHALRLPDGQLEPLHGHDWRIAVTVAAVDLDAMDTVMDFHELEKRVEQVVGPWRNRNLNEVPPFAGRPEDAQGLAINPSAERVAERIAAAVIDALPEHVTLSSVTVGEAVGCAATWRGRGAGRGAGARSS